MHFGKGFRAIILTGIFVISAESVFAQQEYQTALGLYNKRNYAEAAEHFAGAWRVDPNNASAAYYAAYCLYLAGKREDAVNSFWQLVDKLPSRKESMMARQVLQQIDPAYAKHSAGSALTSSSQSTKGGISHAAVPKAETVQDLINGLVQVTPPQGKLPPVTPSFVQSIKQMLTDVPIPVLRLLRSREGHICVLPSVVEKDFRIQNTTPRGWDDSASWKDSPAMCSGQDVVVSQYRYDGRTGDYAENTNDLGVVRHELGHAVDYCLEYVSTTEDFKHAYYLDAAKVPEESRTKLDYFLQRGTAGPSEVFAELCCYMFGGETGGRKESCELVRKYFQLSESELEKRLKELE
jgi:hypothetical protein